MKGCVDTSLRELRAYLELQFHVFVSDKTISVDESLWFSIGATRHYSTNTGLEVYKFCSSGGPGAGYTTAFGIYMRQYHGELPACMKAVVDLLKKGGLMDNWL